MPISGYADANPPTEWMPAWIWAGIEVWADRLDNWVATRAVWNQHAYHITNAGLRGQIPEVEDDSWSTPTAAPFNSYRNNAQGDREALCAPDLVVQSILQDEAVCPDLGVRVVIVNQGCLGVGPGVRVTLYGVDGAPLTTVETAAGIGPGSAIEVVLVVPIGTTWSDVLTVSVDDDGAGQGALNECEERNNASDPLEAGCRFDF